MSKLNVSKSREDLLRQLERFFGEEAERLGVQMAFLFGSRAHGIPREDSDVDLAVLFDEQLSDDEIFNRVDAIALRLVSLLGLDVSILPVYRDFRKPMLYYNALMKGLPVFVRDADACARLRHEAVGQMEDFQIFGPRWQIEAARRNLAHG
jgi:predicted nucleotidyltransferase